MKTVLCFGDSNTFGYNPVDGTRYPESIRWSGILKQNLKEEYNVIEAGCNNRTCFIDNPDGIEQTGYKILSKYLTKSVDILIIALGINDIQKFYNPTLSEIKDGVEKIILLAKEINKNIKIILVSPSTLSNDVLKGYFAFQHDKQSIEKSFKMAEIYKAAAIKFNCEFIDLAKCVTVSKTDGLHYDEAEHKKIATIIENKIKAINLT